jgi:hypothetical protein
MPWSEIQQQLQEGVALKDGTYIKFREMIICWKSIGMYRDEEFGKSTLRYWGPITKDQVFDALMNLDGQYFKDLGAAIDSFKSNSFMNHPVHFEITAIAGPVGKYVTDEQGKRRLVHDRDAPMNKRLDKTVQELTDELNEYFKDGVEESLVRRCCKDLGITTKQRQNPLSEQ